jgi:hypothetical protein
MQAHSSSEISPQLLEQILRNPLLMQQLSDRVCELLQADLRQQRERRSGRGRL